jgi:hypothetical protein
MDSHIPWADKESVGSVARDLAELVSSCGGCGTTIRLAANESTLGALEV